MYDFYLCFQANLGIQTQFAKAGVGIPIYKLSTVFNPAIPSLVYILIGSHIYIMDNTGCSELQNNHPTEVWPTCFETFSGRYPIPC